MKKLILLLRGINVGGRNKLPMTELKKIESLRTDTEKFILREKTFYLYAPEGIARSKVAAGAEKCLGVPVTARNYNTIIKIQSLLEN